MFVTNAFSFFFPLNFVLTYGSAVSFFEVLVVITSPMF